VKYIDSSIREIEHTVAWWMHETASGGHSEFRCQSGYFTSEGASILLDSLKEWSDQGQTTKLLLGSNGASTLATHISFLAGTLGLPREHVALGIVSFQSSLFHPKVYHFKREDGTETAYVGSSNFTGPGISGLNIEAGIVLDSREGDDVEILASIRDRIDDWFLKSDDSLSIIKSSDDIERLLDEGLLSLKKEHQPDEAGRQSGKENQSGPKRKRIGPIFKLPKVSHSEDEANSGDKVEGRSKNAVDADQEAIRRFVRHTEASFHYPQGVHLGHILAILWRFSEGRSETQFADKFIRLSGSLGTGRLGAFRRQIKYKILAAIELQLLSDIRYTKDSFTYTPELTENGEKLWKLVEPNLDTADLIMENGTEYSTSLPKRPSDYNKIIRQSCEANKELEVLYSQIVFAMPAVNQMSEFLNQFPDDQIAKNDIYRGFFNFDPVVEFCNEVGIEPGTEESARHRCPFLLNILESAGKIKQATRHVQRL